MESDNEYIRIEKSAFYKTISIILVLSVIAFWLFSSWYAWGPLRTARAQIAAGFLYTQDLKKAIEIKLLEKKAVEVTAPSKQGSRYIRDIFIKTDGSIIIHYNVNDAFVIMTPVVNNDEVKWDCYGRPKEFVPVRCR